MTGWPTVSNNALKKYGSPSKLNPDFVLVLIASQEFKKGEKKISSDDHLIF